MRDKENRVTVNIIGNEYTMIGKEPEEYIQSVAFYVDKKMKSIRQNNKNLNSTMIAILAALNITDESFKLQQELEATKKEVAKPGKELEDARYQLRKTTEELSRVKNEMNSMKQQLANSQEEATNIYDEWLKIQKEIKELKDKLASMEEVNVELETKLNEVRAEEKRAKEELEQFLNKFDDD